MNDIVHQLRQASLSKEDYRWQAADLIQSLREKTQYWPDNAERDAVIRHQKEVIERLREALFSLGAQANDIRAMLEPR